MGGYNIVMGGGFEVDRGLCEYFNIQILAEPFKAPKTRALGKIALS